MQEVNSTVAFRIRWCELSIIQHADRGTHREGWREAGEAHHLWALGQGAGR
jgi:hypothetical protein